MPDPISGDIVTTADGAEHVVVDVARDDPPLLVLRPSNDPDGVLTAVEIEEVAVVGHLDHLPGWEEYEPGKWRQT